jgi:Plasmid pRiA4b ORF-3-like protein
MRQTERMSPVSRGRKGRRNKKPARRSVQLELLDFGDECHCPECSAVDPQQVIDDLLADAVDLVGLEDPLDAEIAGAAFVSIGAAAGEAVDEVLIDGFIPQFEARASAEAVAMMLALGSVVPGRAAKAAWTAADRLVQAGVARPVWAGELEQPVTVADCQRLDDPDGTGSILACVFHRADRSHAVVISVDHTDCGAASAILLLDADQLPGALEMMRAGARANGLGITTQALDAGEFRWQVDKALDARAVHDDDLPDEDMTDAPAEEDAPGYPALAVLLRARMTALPAPGRPPAMHGDPDGLTAPRLLAQLAGHGGPVRGGLPIGRRGRGASAGLPPKRKKSDRPAPVYQIKVGLRDAKPPIWRRLEVPADISLARLHRVIQVAFGWTDTHLHVFETAYGSFGTADADLGHRAEAPVTLEQVAPTADSKLRYIYDFGDNWEHDLLVERVFDRDQTATYPRCTGGRRAGPPEDCGGIWGYAELVDSLSDPADPEHEDRLAWLGLDDASEFNPSNFDPAAVTRALSALR